MVLKTEDGIVLIQMHPGRNPRLKATIERCTRDALTTFTKVVKKWKQYSADDDKWKVFEAHLSGRPEHRGTVVYDFRDFAICWYGATYHHSRLAEDLRSSRVTVPMMAIGESPYHEGEPAPTQDAGLEEELADKLGQANELLANFAEAVQRDTTDFAARTAKSLGEVKALLAGASRSS